MSKRKVILSLNEAQFADLQALMVEDNQDNFTFYGVYLIQQEKKRREADRTRRPVGRPKKEEEKEEYYANPENPKQYPYTMSELIGYYQIRNKKVPEGLNPIPTEELSKNWPDMFAV